ncbi:MAG: hypothetical protein JXB15_06025, partial [Anaerolineales bacterium]|nr:hypothetical protein [Anaerolineales bacterium]
DKAKAVREIARVLKPGGVLFAATNGQGHMRELGELICLFNPGYPGNGPAVRSFSLESAADVLSTAFNEIEVRRYVSNLEVTEAEPLIDYLHSMWEVYEAGDQVRWRQLEEHVRQIFQSQSVFHIAKSAGLVIARR